MKDAAFIDSSISLTGGVDTIPVRQSVLEGFLRLGHGVRPRQAFRQTKAFYRRARGAWVRELS